MVIYCSIILVLLLGPIANIHRNISILYEKASSNRMERKELEQLIANLRKQITHNIGIVN